ncbi:MAG: tetratricopeptide repeat protein, partial [candidate division Zixibacteria bacterium]|nr:tetratricopeptide repeat protein [candidate division Zixibacteria bacterium]
GGVYQNLGLPDSPLWAYSNLARLQTTNFRLHQEVGRLQAHLGQLDEAIESYRHSISVHPGAENILAYSGLCALYLKQGQPDSAIAVAEAGLQVEPVNIVLNRLLTNIYVSIDSLPQAATHARRVAEAAPLDRFAARRLGSIYYTLDSVRLADSVFTWLVASGERHAANHWFLGRIATRLEQPERAVEQFTHLVMLADTVAESWLDLGFAYRQLDSLDGEIKTYQSGLHSMVDEDSAIRLLFALGAAHERDGNIAKAVTTFEEIIEKRPSHDPSLNYLGYLLADRGERLEYAKKLIEKALAISSENAAYVDSYGWVLFRMGQYKEAVKHLEKAVSLDNDPVIFDHLGDAYQATGKLDEARKWWQKALDRQPNNAVIQRKLGN